MKLLFICGDVNLVGGIEKYNRDLLQALSRDSTGVKVTKIARKRGGLGEKIRFMLLVLSTIGRERPDHIYCAHLNFSPMCLAIRKIVGTKYTLALYGIEINGIKGIIKRQAVSEADRIVTISEFTKGQIIERLPSVGCRVYMLPSAVDGEKFKIRDRAESLIIRYGLIGRSVIMTLARLATKEEKGQDRVLKAMPLVLKHVPNAVYIIVGGGSDQRIDRIMRENPELASSVILTGAIENEERVDYYNLADVFVHPSKLEGFGIVFIETLACGVPVIASEGYGCREGLDDGELGLLVDPDDIEGIATAIVSILKKEAPARLYRKQWLRQKTLEMYGMDKWEVGVDKLVRLIRSSSDS